MVGKGGNVGLGIFGGSDGRGGNWRSWRAARATLMPEKTKAKEKAMMKNLKEAITSRFYCNSKFMKSFECGKQDLPWIYIEKKNFF